MVYATGTDTYFGKTAQMVQGPESASHFQKAVLKLTFGGTLRAERNDRVKLLAYRILDPTKRPLRGRKPKDQKPRDLKPEIETRAYELFEKRARADGQATEDWAEAEREIDKEHDGVSK
jgi:hypothetical protein